MRRYFRTERLTREGLASTKPYLVALFSFVVLSGYVQSQELSQLPGQQSDPYTISVDVDMVVLHATVRNHKGIVVSGLSQDDFQVYEDGVPQSVESFSHEDIPVTVGLVVDNSGSMRLKRPEVIVAALAFVRYSNPKDQMFVINFNENVSFGLPDTVPFTDKVGDLQVALSRIAANGMTALYDAVGMGVEHLKKGNRDKKVLIVISDGGDNASKNNLAGLMSTARQSNTIIYTIGLFDANDPDRNPRALNQLARATGGDAFLPGSLKEVLPICERIAQDIRNQYSISYAPTNKRRDGTYRAIRVTARARGRERLWVRTRAGYNAPMKPLATGLNASP